MVTIIAYFQFYCSLINILCNPENNQLKANALRIIFSQHSLVVFLGRMKYKLEGTKMKQGILWFSLYLVTCSGKNEIR